MTSKTLVPPCHNTDDKEIKIEEQKELDIKAISAACHALGFSTESRTDVVRHYEWLLTLRLIQKGMPKTETMAKQHAHAERNYLISLERAISKTHLKKTNWTKAGRAMLRVYKEAYTKTR